MVLKKSSKFFYSGLFFLLGVALGEVVHIVFLWPLIITGFFILVGLFSRRQRIVFIFIAALTFGLFLNNFVQPKLTSQHISFYNGQTKTFSVWVTEEPDVRLDQQKLTVRPLDFKGKILLSLPLYPKYSYGQELEVVCKLQAPEAVEDFQYDKYLARYGVYSVCYQPKINLLDERRGNFLIAGIFKLKEAFESKINRTLAEPQASLMAGILIGSRQGIPQKLLTQFNLAGVTHIIAISGFNITIIVALFANLFKQLRVNRKKSFWLIVAGLIFFVILTGASASVVRAAIMGLIVLWAKQLGRVSKVRNVLMLSAVLMVLINPRILFWDAGFQLSFLSTLGLVYLSPKLKKGFQWLPEQFALRENLTSTLSAIIFTLPLILFNFHRLSIVAPLVNLLVLPAIPISMFVGFMQVIGAFVWVGLGQFIGWFSWLLLSYVIKVVEFFSSWSWSAVNLRIDWWLMLLLYAILIWIVVRSPRVNRGDKSDGSNRRLTVSS